MSNYSTNLTEKQWQVIKNIVEPQEKSRKYLTIEVAPKFGQNHFYLNKLWNDCEASEKDMKMDET